MLKIYNYILTFWKLYDKIWLIHKLVSIFSRLVIPFPFGTVVCLSNGDIGIVQDTPTNFPLRPNVKIIESSNRNNTGNSICLVNELSLAISEVKTDYVLKY